jgi:hypothetical protein
VIIMSIKADDLDKYKSLMSLLASWDKDASKLGFKLNYVRVQAPGNSSVDLSLTESPPNPAYWEIS